MTWCLKITEKVSFNIASEASYVYKSSWKNAKMVHLASLWKTVLPDIFYRTKSGDKCQYWNTQMGQFGGFSNIVYTVWMEKEKGRLDLQTHWHFESDRIWRRKWRPLLGWYISRKMVTDEIFLLNEIDLISKFKDSVWKW